MTGYIGTDAGRRTIGGMWVGTPQGKKEVLRAFIGTASGNRIWYEKAGLTTVDLTVGTVTFRSAVLNWTVLGPVDRYKITRNSLVIYDKVASAGLTWTDTNLTPSTSYTYKIEAILGGVAISTDTATASTGAAPAITISAASGGWDRTTITWGNINAEAYEIYRNDATLVYSGGHVASITDTGLWFNSDYYYTVYAYWGTKWYSRGQSANVRTNNRSGMGFRAIGQQNQIYFDWNDQNGGGVTGYEVWLYSPSVGIIGGYAGPGAGSGYHTNLPNGWTGYYELTAFRGGEVIHKEQAGANTWFLRTGSVGGDATQTATGWTGSTVRYMTGRDFAFPVSGTMTNVNGVYYGHYEATYNKSGNGRVAAVIGGVERDSWVFGSTRQANDIPVSVGYAAGTHSVGIRAGGTNWGQTTWSPPTPTSVSWAYNVCIHRVDYQYWSTTREFEELRRFSWWDRGLEDNERDIHLDTWDDGNGSIIRAKITDKDTGETLVEWEA